MDKRGREEFGRYISEIREKHGVSMERLSDGLCSLSMLGRFEKGERFPDKLLRDRFLARMGENADSYENYLNYDEYNAWKIRQQLLQAMVDLDEIRTAGLLRAYLSLESANNPIDRQFTLAIEGMLLKRRKACEREVADIYDKAVRLTVPNIESDDFDKKVLSMQEIYLVLEYVNYNKSTEDKMAWFERILTYILESPLTAVCRAKIYPQTVYYLCRELEQRGIGESEVQVKMLQLCNRAIEMLRDAGGSYYLWELLLMRKKALDEMKAYLLKRGEVQKAEALRNLEKDNDEYLWAVQEVRAEFGRPMEMQDECYLYVEKEAYCIGDVIRIRRKMLGLSREQLCDGICSLKTIGRIENNKMKTQRPIIKELLERLNLPTEFQRTELVSSDLQVHELMNDIRWSINERENDKVEQKLSELKELVSMDIALNRQTVRRMEVLNAAHKGELTKGKLYAELREILEYTIPYETVFSEGKQYLTKTELHCVYSIMCAINWDEEERNRVVESLQRYCDTLKNENCIGAHVNSYEFIMTEVASQLGDKGEYDESDAISKIILTECFKWNRLPVICSGIYNLTWNYEQREKKHISTEKKRDVLRDLNLCILYSRFTKMTFRTERYKIKLKQRMK